VLEHQSGLRLAEAAGLASTVEQIRGFEAAGEQIAAATARWQSVQDAAEKTARQAKEMATQLTTEAHNFADAMQRAHDVEVRNLRLEVEKWRRAEGEWMQVLVRVMDHVYAVHVAGLNSGRPELASQLTQFQNACRDAIRRVGLVPLEASPDTAFDSSLHELAPGTTGVNEGRVAQTLATGFTYQGQLVRRGMVALKPAAPAA
jgi:molecular chaperone GrpE (heat shock protein)